MTDWERIADAVGLALAGERAGTPCVVWVLVGDDRDRHAQRCIIAHYLADLQSSLDDEVTWDEAALFEHAHVTGKELAPLGIASAAGMAPSLHLNLGDGYLRQGRVEAARTQVDAGMKVWDALPTDQYGALIRSGPERLEERVQEAESA